ncbi:MAG TPA: Holliday junction branch migration protein RuvA [Firmicutes bacterium]|nr:Holliday junction branch migration protein RuvA [Bacillota bacterium]
MIASVRGEIILIEEDSLVVEVNHLGYQVYAPLQRMVGQYQLNDEIFLYTHLIVREDQWTLFGFLTSDELTLFRLLLTVSGIGGKGALGVLNQMSPQQIVGAMATEDSRPFEKVTGIGKKTAQRIVLELKDKVAKLSISGTEVSGEEMLTEPISDHDAIEALCQLGYTKGEAKKAVVKILCDDPAIDNDNLLRKALTMLSKF